MSKKESERYAEKRPNTASLQVNLQRCARPPEIHSAIMSAREFWCRRKNPVNGYHYYSYAQISSYYFIRTFRELDCSVGDIKNTCWAGRR